MNPIAGISRSALGLGLLGLLAFAVGFLGQGSFGIGARAAPTAVSAIVTDVIGGAGSRGTVRIQVSVAVINDGTDQVRVLGPLEVGDTTRVLGLSPAVLDVGPGAIGRVEADVTAQCESAEPLQLPALRLELVDGVRRQLPVGDSGMLLEACSRAVATIRPLVITVTPQPRPARTPTPTRTGGGREAERRLAVRLSSPTGRPIQVTEIRAGGVPVLTARTPVTVKDKTGIAVELLAPRTCPVQWQVAGVPSSLTVDLSSGSQPGATALLKVGPALTGWLLDTACREVR